MIEISLLFVAAWLGGFALPWWWPGLAAFAVGLWLPRRAGSAFTYGFTAVAAAWGLWALLIDQRNHHLLSGRIAILFHLPGSAAAVILTALIGGLIGGLPAWAGFAWRHYLKPHPPEPSGPYDDDLGESHAGDVPPV